jgi:ABC-type sugar transport system ATPase subunit
MSQSTPPAVRFDRVIKRFPGALALDDVSFAVAPGSCHAVCGENGAGKSTLGKLLAGIHPLDGGRILIAGAEVHLHSPADARAAGIGMVHQELAFAENMTVAENLSLGSLPGSAGWLDRAGLQRRARTLLESIGAEQAIDVRRPMGALTVGEQQLCQIAAAVGSGARIIVFDEPTSSLSEHEAQQLGALIGRLRAQGVTMLYVSHRMPEIYRLCDTITVLRDGKHVVTAPVAELDEGALVKAMIGRVIDPGTTSAPPAEAAPLLQVSSLSSPGKFADLSFSVRPGEIVGLGGLVGAGRSELLAALFGLDPQARGEIRVGGKPAALSSPEAAMALGLGLVPEDRKRQGLVLGLSARANLTLPLLTRPLGEAGTLRLSRFGFIRHAAEKQMVLASFQRLRVRAPHVDFVAAGLSGGNQQKLVLARWLSAGCRILMLDEPTRGIDVGAKAEIHGLIAALAEAGVAVVLVSSELPELIKLSHRVLVLREGRLAGELPRAAATEESLLALMSGVTGVSATA